MDTFREQRGLLRIIKHEHDYDHMHNEGKRYNF